MFPRIEPAVVALIFSALAVPVVTELENDFDVPVIHVAAISGQDDGFRLARWFVDIDYYASTRALADVGAHSVQDVLLNAPGTVLDGGTVLTYARTTIGPRWLPSSRTNVRRFGATYQIGVHTA